MKQKQIHRYREKSWGCQREKRMGEGWSKFWGLADANYYIQNR